ncbi:hypothetical protein E4T56_gene10290 [Termitomyces sp. T112]|nr:hypothetical protein E4T56_gene10290 [Termitomyces sp. T112]
MATSVRVPASVTARADSCPWTPILFHGVHTKHFRKRSHHHAARQGNRASNLAPHLCTSVVYHPSRANLADYWAVGWDHE